MTLTFIFLNQFKIATNDYKTKVSARSFTFTNEKTCSLYHIEPEPNYIVFMGVFHCTWMNNINSETNPNNDYYYLTKSYKGSSVTLCQNTDELRSNRCYKHLPLKYSYYGTGHTVYKDYMFYTQDSSRFLISHSIKIAKSSEEIDADEARQIKIPEDAECCDTNNNLYSVKHSGFFICKCKTSSRNFCFVIICCYF